MCCIYLFLTSDTPLARYIFPFENVHCALQGCIKEFKLILCSIINWMLMHNGKVWWRLLVWILSPSPTLNYSIYSKFCFISSGNFLTFADFFLSYTIGTLYLLVDSVYFMFCFLFFFQKLHVLLFCIGVLLISICLLDKKFLIW